jgi:hypothetical protein
MGPNQPRAEAPAELDHEVSSDDKPSASVFISYATDEDGGVTRELVRALENTGITAWIAERDLEGSQSYARGIVTAIRASKAVIVMCSIASEASSDVENELNIASRHRVPILPLRIDSLDMSGSYFEYYLGTKQWIDAHGDQARWLPRVLRALENLGMSPAQT